VDEIVSDDEDNDERESPADFAPGAPLREGVRDFRAKESRLAPAKSLDATPLLQGDEERDLKDPSEFENRDESSDDWRATAPCGVSAGAAEPPQLERVLSASALAEEDSGRVEPLTCVEGKEDKSRLS